MSKQRNTNTPKKREKHIVEAIKIVNNANEIIRTFHPCLNCDFFGKPDCNKDCESYKRPAIGYDEALKILEIEKLDKLISITEKSINHKGR